MSQTADFHRFESLARMTTAHHSPISAGLYNERTKKTQQSIILGFDLQTATMTDVQPDRAVDSFLNMLFTRLRSKEYFNPVKQGFGRCTFVIIH